MDESPKTVALVGAHCSASTAAIRKATSWLLLQGVEQSDRSPMTMAGTDPLFLSHEYLGAVVRGRA
jgi:hypothetical protein